ncbi:DUF4239 domain-containing protein [Nonomuraea lactucae]|uniref:bestrophin-like domain n=1 Tax=Nonomuraea lactucae TaxID=2249762 RepID=UPI000DE2C3A2|nr:DUF4239 domain-containing protein [Nonomuraea lactucae]
MVAYALAVAAAVSVVALTALVFKIASKGSPDGRADGPSAGHAGSMLSALFLLVFAIAIIVPWTTADAARQNTHAESRAAVDAYWSASGLPGTGAELTRAGLRDYVTFVVDDEWQAMRQGRLHPVGTERLDALRTRVVSMEATSTQALEARTEVLGHLATLSGARAQRAADAASTPPPGVLILTLVTGVLVIVFPFLAGARPRGAALLPLLAMAALLGFGTYLTWDISHVFDGPLAVEPDAFRGALEEFTRIAGGV